MHKTLYAPLWPADNDLYNSYVLSCKSPYFATHHAVDLESHSNLRIIRDATDDSRSAAVPALSL